MLVFIHLSYHTWTIAIQCTVHFLVIFWLLTISSVCSCLSTVVPRLQFQIYHLQNYAGCLLLFGSILKLLSLLLCWLMHCSRASSYHDRIRETVIWTYQTSHVVLTPCACWSSSMEFTATCFKGPFSFLYFIIHVTEDYFVPSSHALRWIHKFAWYRCPINNNNNTRGKEASCLNAELGRNDIQTKTVSTLWVVLWPLCCHL